MIIPPPGYWAEIQRICRAHDVLLIADEVICGFGRTGRWWGSETFEIAPDLMTVAKGLSSGYLPIAALLLGERVGDALVASGQEWTHGFTYSGHPVCAAVALENLRLIEQEGLHERASGPLGAYFARALATLADHPLVGEVRACGLIAALELVADKAARRPWPPARRVGLACRDRCVEHGLVMRAVARRHGAGAAARDHRGRDRRARDPRPRRPRPDHGRPRAALGARSRAMRSSDTAKAANG